VKVTRALVLIAFALLTMVAGCLAILLFLTAPSHDEVARVTSPDGSMDAVLVESDDGATDPHWYDVYVVPKGSPYWTSPSSVVLYGATRNANASGADLRWETPLRVGVEYLDAERAKVEVSYVNVGAKEVVVVRRLGIVDAHPPEGNMISARSGDTDDASR
jgi:hypothetical protein